MLQLYMTRTRFAPSPTGYLHIGGLRTAAYAYALAKHENGEFLLRIEDTDQKREVPGSKEKIQEVLKSFGLQWDELHVQSERVNSGIYKETAQKLLDQGNAFYCQCEAKPADKDSYSKILHDPCRDKNLNSGAIKLKIPENQTVEYVDFVVQKNIKWHSKEIADTTLLKSDGFPTYHLAVVVDDHDMDITHVLRGHDWLPSTPIHLFLYKFLDYDVPQIGHLTDIQDPSGGKLSKRKGNVSVEQFLEEGYLPEALFNFVILLGWAPKDNREFFTLKEFVENFDIKGFQKSNPVMNTKKLDWFNGQYIRQLSDEQFLDHSRKFYPEDANLEMIKDINLLIKDRLKKFSEIPLLTNFFFNEQDIDFSLFVPDHENHLQKSLEALENLEDWNQDTVSRVLTQAIADNSFHTGDFFMNLRIAITGQKFTPPISESIAILGKEEATNRIKKCLLPTKKQSETSSS
jgi:glutamyl-tRNA synthetase